MSLEVWHSCDQQDAAVEAQSKATEAPHILQPPGASSDRGKIETRDHKTLSLQTYNLHLRRLLTTRNTLGQEHARVVDYAAGNMAAWSRDGLPTVMSIATAPS